MNHYPGKILLFGEYLVLEGGQALAVPTKGLHSQWDYMDSIDSRLSELAAHIEIVADKLSGQFNLTRFGLDIERGLVLKSSIPMASGLGSSGALVAAVYDRYVKDKPQDLSIVRRDLGLIEQLYHQSSSGFDALVSYVRKPLLKNSRGITVLGQLRGIDFELVDSGISREGRKWIALFKEKMSKDPSFVGSVKRMIELSDQLVDTIASSKCVDWNLLRAFAHIQVSTMSDFFTPAMIEFANKGIESDAFVLKLCGAGGGGYFLKINNKST